MSCNKIITITRQYGSGGHEIGKALSEKLGIGFYDKELISIAAKESGISPELFAKADEKPANSLLYSLSTGLYNYGNNFSTGGMGDLPLNDKLYLLQHKIIKEKAEKEFFVVVGRCADYILRSRPGILRVFIQADLPSRIQTIMERKSIDEDAAKKLNNFVVTGDHAERFNFASDVSLWALSGIPCYFYGDGVRRDLLDEQMAGSHLQIAPTLAELILPTGSAYASLLPPLMESNRAFNHRLYIEDGDIGEQKNLADDAFRQEIEAARTVASWVVMHDR